MSELQSSHNDVSNDSSSSGSTDDRRLWIGNLDPRVNEYHLIKLLQKHGAIDKFDLLFHRNGPLAGQPRGYAFVTYKNKEEAVAAKDLLHDMLVGQKRISVTWAHSVNNVETEKPKLEVHIPALAMSKAEKKQLDRQSQIQAIEAKLKLMEKKASDELEINKTVATEPPIISQFQYNKNQTASSSSSIKLSTLRRNDKRSNKPYSKHKTRY